MGSHTWTLRFLRNFWNLIWATNFGSNISTRARTIATVAIMLLLVQRLSCWDNSLLPHSLSCTYICVVHIDQVCSLSFAPDRLYLRATDRFQVCCSHQSPVNARKNTALISHPACWSTVMWVLTLLHHVSAFYAPFVLSMESTYMSARASQELAGGEMVFYSSYSRR
jgi:hypothetical protein